MDHEAEDRETLARAQTSAGSMGNGGSRVYRGTFSYALSVAFVFLLLVGITLLDPGAAAAQDLSDTTSKAGGRDLGLRDWLDHLPLVLGAALVVVAVDAIVIVKVIRNWNRHQ